MDAEIANLGPGAERDSWLQMKAEAEQSVAAQDATLTKLQTQLEALQAELPQTDAPSAPKFDPAKHPLLRKAVEKQEPEKPVVFSTGDICEAQWTDKSWYKAKIQSVLGSSSAPKYIVRFIDYADSTLTVERNAVRPLAKRNPHPEPAAPQSNGPVTSTPHVISGPASVNPNAASRTAASTDAEPKQPSRLPNKGQLKKRASNWQDFQAKQSKKVPQKESMFRTSTDIGSKGRVTHCPHSSQKLTEHSWLHRFRQGHDRDAQTQTIRP